MTERSLWEGRLAQAARDLEELEQQLAEGEIPESTGETLRATYLEEMEEARRRLTEPTATADPPSDPPRTKPTRPGFWTRGRILVLAILGTAAVALVISVGWFAQTDPPPAEEPFDPSRYSDETMEAVIAANSEHPGINGMRLALAGRYFQAGDFQGAFLHYREVLERNPSSHEEGEALSRLGWMAWAGSGETQLALQTLDRALAAAPDDPQTLYFKAMVLWCGAGRPEEAVPLLEEVTEALPSETAVAADLTAARARQECP